MSRMPRRLSVSIRSRSSSRFAARGNRDDHIVGSQHAQIAVRRFGGVQKLRRSAGAGEGGGDFAADETGFAHAGDDHAAFAAVEQLDGLLEAGVEALDEAGDGFGLDAQDALGGLETHAFSQRAHELGNFQQALQQRLELIEGSAFEPSESAFGGLSCTSTKIPSAPAATLARASGSMNSGWPPLDFPSAPGNCTECVASKTTG